MKLVSKLFFIAVTALMASVTLNAQTTKIDPNTQVGPLTSSSNAMLPGIKIDGSNGLTISGVVTANGFKAAATQITVTYYLDGSRTDTYTPDGSQQWPYTTLDGLFNAINTYSTSYPSANFAIISAPGTYTTSTTLATPAAGLIIYGNNSKWYMNGGFTSNSIPLETYDLNLYGSMSYAICSASGAGSKHGGSYNNGTITFAAGCAVNMYGVALSSATITNGGTIYADTLTGSGKLINSSSTSSFILNRLMLSTASGYNVDNTGGGLVVLLNSSLSASASTANVYDPTANSSSLPNVYMNDQFKTGLGVVCVSGTTTYISYANLSLPPTSCTINQTYVQGNDATHPISAWWTNSLTDTGLTTAGIVTNTSAGLMGTTTTVPIANGGTGAATSSAYTAFGNFTGSTAAPSFTSFNSNVVSAPVTGTDTGTATAFVVTLTPTMSSLTKGTYPCQHRYYTYLGSIGTNCDHYN